MALKPTIYKVAVELADSDRNIYESLSLTIAKHPSETLQRMSARLLAYCFNCAAGLEFTRGISTADEPDIWLHSDHGEIEHWVEVGQPEEPRLRKACGRARQVSVFAFAKSAPTWWQLNGAAISALQHIRVWQFNFNEVSAFSELLDRTTQITASIAGGTIYLDCKGQSCSVEPHLLLSNE